MLARRTNRWWVLGVILLPLILATGSGLAEGAESWNPTLLHQSPVAVIGSHGTGQFGLSLRTNGTNGAGDAADLFLYPMLRARSQLAPIIAGTGATGLPLASTGRFALDCQRGGVATFAVTVGVRAGTGATTCAHAAPYLNLGCGSGACSGVYPLAITTSNGQTTSTIWSLVAVTATPVASPVNLALIVRSNPATTAATTKETAALRALSGFASTPLTIAVDYRGISRVLFSPSTSSANYRSALAHALAPAPHALVNAPPPSIDFAALSPRLLSDVTSQSRLATILVSQFSNKFPSPEVVLSGAVTPAGLSALAAVRVNDVVLPDTSLTVAPSGTLGWGTPFGVVGASGAVVGVATDTPLRTLAEDAAIAPGLRAALTLGELSMLHFQAPYASVTRTVFLDADLTHLAPSYLTSLLTGLHTDPLVNAVGLSGQFAPARVGANGYPSLRTLAPVSAPAWTSNNLTTTVGLEENLRSFSQSISSLQPTTPLQVDTLYAERMQPAADRQEELADARDGLTNQTSAFHVDDDTITLAGSGTPLPVTLTSSANYHATGWLELSAPGVSFPEGSANLVTMSASTYSVRVPANFEGSGNFTLNVRFVTLDRRMDIAIGVIQVRSTVTSPVGYVLTGGALVVIALWWWRTSRRRVRGRHAK